MSGVGEPVPFEVYEPGVYLHGTKADLTVGQLLVAGRESNFEAGRLMNYVYFTATLDAAVWGAELASGEGRGRIYVVEPLGEFEDDPNVTNKKFPGNPTQSFRSREPLRIVDELLDWVGHSPETLEAMRPDSIPCSRRERARSRTELVPPITVAPLPCSRDGAAAGSSPPGDTGCAWPAVNAAPLPAPSRKTRLRRRSARRTRAEPGRCRA